METLLSSIVGIVTIIALTNVWFELRLAVPPVPTMPKVRRAVVAQIPPGSGTIVELGAGCGGLTLQVAREFQHRAVVGIELSPFPYIAARVLQLLSGQKNLVIRRQNLFEYSLREAEVVVMYLTPVLLQRVAGKLRAELPRGATVVCSSFPLPDWVPEKTVDVCGLWRTTIFVYRQS